METALPEGGVEDGGKWEVIGSDLVRPLVPRPQVVLEIEIVDQPEEVVQTEPVAFRIGEPQEQGTA